MIILNLLICLINSKEKKSALSDLIIGEWDIVNGEKQVKEKSLSPYSAEFHADQKSSLVEGSIWRNINNPNGLLDLDDIELAQLEIEFFGPLSGQVFNPLPTRSFMTKFEFNPTNFGYSFITRGKINDNFSFQMTLNNGTFFQIFITEIKSNKVLEFYAVRSTKPSTKSTKYPNYLKLGIIVCIALLLLQVGLWFCMKNYKSRMEEKLSEQQENTVIDLDKYSEYLKEQKKAKKD